MKSASDVIAIVTRSTRLDKLKRRRGTAGAAKFALGQARQHAKADRRFAAVSRSDLAIAEHKASYSEYEEEDEAHSRGIQSLRESLQLGFPIAVIDRDHVPNYDFGRCQLIVTVGQDGLVANVAKYAGDTPIIGVNPDPDRNDGVLAQFTAKQARGIAQRVLEKTYRTRRVTLAEVSLNDGQRMLAFNDFFVGKKGHSSARYTLAADEKIEAQSSSGIVVSTGAGSTGWFSSLFNMARGFAQWRGGEVSAPLNLPWQARKLAWAVREPFISRHSSAGLAAGLLEDGKELIIESLMPEDGIIFSDGMERDYLEFTSGTIARIFVSQQSANLVGAH